MPITKATIGAFVSPDEFRDVIIDVESYPDFLAEVKRVEVVERSDEAMVATFWVEVAFAGVEVKTEYTLRYVLGDREIRWTLESSPDLTENCGAWRLEEGDDSDETIARYEAEVVTSLPIPAELQALFAEQTLPEMLEHFRDRAESL